MYTRSVPKEIKELLIEVSNETGFDYNIVEDIYFHQFRFLSEMMAKGEKGNYPTFENILLKRLGSFIANEKHINKLKEITDENLLERNV